MLGIIGSIFPVVGRIVRAANEAQEALKAGQDFAAEVEKTLEGDHPLRDKATSMVKEFQEAGNGYQRGSGESLDSLAADLLTLAGTL